MFLRCIKGIIVTVFTLLILGCSSTPDQTTHYEPHLNDPFEGFNRAMWSINYEFLDPYILRPTAMAYVNYTPTPVRKSIANVLSNLDEPASMINNLLMGNGETALNNFNRFWINSTFGLLGLLDIAGEAGIVAEERVFSDTLGHYGIGNGPYFMIPAYGPAITRESTDLVDNMYIPLSYLNIWAGLGKWALEGLENRAELAAQEALLEASPDPYAFTREVYLQRRDYKAQIESDEFDEAEEDFLDEYLEDEF